MGIALKKQVKDSFKGTNTDYVIFKGSYSPEDPEDPYDGDSKKEKGQQNQDVFRNRRAQYYIRLRDRIYKTYQMIKKKELHDKDDLISFSSSIEKLDMLRSEICKIPSKPNASRMMQIMSKDEMKTKFDIDSPNMADSVMMLMVIPKSKLEDNWTPPTVHKQQRSASRYTHSAKNRRY